MVFRSPSGFVVVVLGAVAIALLFFPVPLHTDDSGWIWDLCGSLLDKPVVDHPFPDIEATNCELQGVYRRRILVVGATLGLAWLVACGVMVRADARRCSWTRFGVSALAAALAIGVLWSQNDRTSAGYPFAPIGAAVERTSAAGSSTLAIRGFGWTQGGPIDITSCHRPPEDCNDAVATVEADGGEFDVEIRRELTATMFVVDDGVVRQWISAGGPTLEELRSMRGG